MSSSSDSSYFSYLSSSPSSELEYGPEYDEIAAYEALAPLWWDDNDWDFSVWSEDGESLTDGEDNLQFLVDGELEPDSDDDRFTWDGFSSPDEEEEEEDYTSSEEYPPVKRFRCGSWDDSDDEDEEDEARADGFSSSDYGDDDGSSADEDEDDDDEDLNGGAGPGH